MSLTNTANAPLGPDVIAGLIVATVTTLIFVLWVRRMRRVWPSLRPAAFPPPSPPPNCDRLCSRLHRYYPAVRLLVPVHAGVSNHVGLNRPSS
jgi:hypothetical protein